jgi:uncharacterized protein (UPF0371 family)
MFEAIYGYSPYKSPTDMGVNMAGFAICNSDVSAKASKDEIIRRYLNTIVLYRNGKATQEAIDKIALLMQAVNVSVDDRPSVQYSLEKQKKTNTPSMAITLDDGVTLTSKTSPLLSAPAALILNALKHLANISDDVLLISPEITEPISRLKIHDLGNHNPRLHADEVLIALAICAKDDEVAARALSKISELKHTQAHSTVILPESDERVFKKLGIDLTTEPESYAQKLYRKVENLEN